MTYAPQGPTAFCNGPTCAQMQGDWIVAAVNHLRDTGRTKMTPESAAEQQWRDQLVKLANETLLPTAKSVSLIFFSFWLA
jgi:hypothetical protein